MSSAILELDAGARDQVCDGSRHEDLGRAAERGDASTEMDCDSADVLAAQFDLSGVNPGADFDPEGSDAVADRAGATASEIYQRAKRRNRLFSGVAWTVETRCAVGWLSPG